MKLPPPPRAAICYDFMKYVSARQLPLSWGKKVQLVEKSEGYTKRKVTDRRIDCLKKVKSQRSKVPWGSPVCSSPGCQNWPVPYLKHLSCTKRFPRLVRHLRCQPFAGFQQGLLCFAGSECLLQLRGDCRTPEEFMINLLYYYDVLCMFHYILRSLSLNMFKFQMNSQFQGIVRYCQVNSLV